jgi:hypothetical protein
LRSALVILLAAAAVVLAVLRSLQVDFIYFQFPWGRRLDFVVVAAD